MKGGGRRLGIASLQWSIVAVRLIENIYFFTVSNFDDSDLWYEDFEYK